MKTCTVVVKLPHGIVIPEDPRQPTLAHDGADHPKVMCLRQGINRGVPYSAITSWLAKNSTLRCVKRGDVVIANDAQRRERIRTLKQELAAWDKK